MAQRPWPRSFTDRLSAPLPSYRDVWKMMRERGPARDLVAEASAIPVAAAGAALPPVEPGTGAITWVGHASFVIRIGGLTMLTDPVWSRRIPAVAPRLTRPGVDWDALPPIDAVVISHNHYDHLDAPTIRRLPRETPILVPAKLARWFHRRGFTAVTELDWWESQEIGPVTFGDAREPKRVRCDFVPAHHWSRRTLTDTCRSLWGGWVLTDDHGARIYFAGDTGYGHWFTEIGNRYPGIDLALLPIGAYEPRWFMHSMHVSPEEAVRACEDLRATRMATMHWGTFMLSGEPFAEPPERTVKAWAEADRPREHLWDLAVGETRHLRIPAPH